MMKQLAISALLPRLTATGKRHICKSESFTLIELLVITSHLCCDLLQSVLKKNKTRGMVYSPAHGQVKLYSFTLIELLVVTSQLCRDFFRGFICTDKYGCVRKHTENAALKNTPLFFESERGFGGKRKPSFLVKKSLLVPSHHTPLLSLNFWLLLHNRIVFQK